MTHALNSARATAPSPPLLLPLPLLQLPAWLVCFLFSLELFDNTLLVIDGIYYCRYCLSSSSCFCCCCCCSSPHLCAVFAVLYRWKECLILAQKNSCQLAAYRICHTRTLIQPPHSYTQLVYNSYTTRILLLNSSYSETALTQSLSHLFTYTTTTTYRVAQLLYAPPVTSAAQTGCAAANSLPSRLVRSYKTRARSLLSFQFVICNLFDFIYFPFRIGLSYNRIGIYGIYFVCCCCLYSFFALCNLAESHQSVSSWGE